MTATVGVNLTWLVPGVVGGSEEYTVRLLEAAAPLLGPDLALRLYGSPALLEAHPVLAEHHTFVASPDPPGGRAGRIAVENTWLARHSAADRIVHHAGGTVPFRRPGPCLVTIFDLQPLDHPEHFGVIKRRWLQAGLPRAAAAARLVLCLSDHTASRLRDKLGVPEERLRVVPYGQRVPEASADGTGTADDDPRDTAPPVPGRYLLYPAIAYPHKRHLDLVRLLDRLGPDHDDVTLVLTGRPGPETPAIEAEAARLGVGHRVRSLGRVPTPELERLYRHAAALVFPSAYEGFGLPVLEAMAAGCPVVTSDAGALPEVVGEAGLVVPVGDVDALAAACTRLLGDVTLSGELQRRGRDRVRDFDIGIAAGRLVDVYREAVEPVRP